MEEWILCSDVLPKEIPSITAKFYGTPQWRPWMCVKISSKVLVTLENAQGDRYVTTGWTIDGEWHVEKSLSTYKVIAWRIYPKPYDGGVVKDDTNRSNT